MNQLMHGGVLHVNCFYGSIVIDPSQMEGMLHVSNQRLYEWSFV